MSNGVSRAEVVDPSVLSEEQLSLFIDKLFSLHQQIFGGLDKAEFMAFIIDSPSEWTRIRIYKNNQDEWVGFCAVHRYSFSVDKRNLAIFRAQAGILRAYRGRSMTLWFGFSEAIKYHLLHLFRSVYYFGGFLHPAVLYMFSRYIHEFYPRPGIAIPAETKRLMIELAERFKMQPVEGQHELVRHIGARTLESGADQEFWHNHQNPTVKYFIAINPGYVNGNALLALMPLTFYNIFVSLFYFLKSKSRRLLLRSG